MIKVILELIHFNVAAISTYYCYTMKTGEINSNACCYLVAGVCLLDIGLHLLKLHTLRKDMIFHHIFALFIILFVYNHTYPVTYNIETKNELTKNVLLTEVSSMFLVANNILQKKTLAKKMAQVLFAGTFFYYRIYNFVIKIVANKQTNLFIFAVAKHEGHLLYMYAGIYGLISLNIYWGRLIAQKVLSISNK